MPVTLEFNEPETFVLNGTGQLTFAECHQVLADLAAHPRFSEGARVLADARNVTKAPSTEELRALVQDLQPMVDRGVRSMGILTETTFVYGVARMFAVFAELLDFKVAVFKSTTESERWLRAGEAPEN